MSRSVEFFFDVGSPSTYLAWTQLPKLCADAGATLIFRPMLLGGVFQATGNASPVSVPAKGAYTRMDFQRFARRYGVTLVQNPYFPVNTLVLMRALTGAQLHTPERFHELLEVIFRGMWLAEQNFNEPAVLGAWLANNGFDPQALLELASRQDVKDALRQTTEEAVARGVFGAPSMFVGDELFFGQDRLDFVREALAG